MNAEQLDNTCGWGRRVLEQSRVVPGAEESGQRRSRRRRTRVNTNIVPWAWVLQIRADRMLYVCARKGIMLLETSTLGRLISQYLQDNPREWNTELERTDIIDKPTKSRAEEKFLASNEWSVKRIVLVADSAASYLQLGEEFTTVFETVLGICRSMLWLLCSFTQAVLYQLHKSGYPLLNQGCGLATSEDQTEITAPTTIAFEDH